MKSRISFWLKKGIYMEFVPAKTIVTRAKSGAWFGSDYNMNIYRGCCHGCIYCDSRSECYGVEEFDRVRAKKDAIRIIGAQLRAKRKKGVVATGAMSDPYNPFEKEYGLTRKALMLLDKYRFGVAVDTKSDLIVRDADVLCAISSHSPVIVKITVTSTDDSLAGKIEPHAPPPSRRLAAVEKLAARGIYTGLLLMPLLPFVADDTQNIGKILHAAKDAGARFVYAGMGVTLRQNQRAYFLEKIDSLYPGMRARYEKYFGQNYHCIRARKMLWDFFEDECEKLGILYKMEDIVTAYKEPYAQKQVSFFD